MTNPSRMDLLVSADELAGHLGAPDWVIVDCRFNLARPDAGEAAYGTGHIRGAWYAHLDHDLSSPRTAISGRHPLPAPQDLVALFSRWGVRPNTQVVAYDDVGGAIAARLWWLLKWMGHEHAALLDGGIAAWMAAGHPLSTAPPVSRPAPFAGVPGQMATINLDELQRRLNDPSLRVLDARAPARFRGDEEPIDPVAGHVPGAVNAPFQSSLAGDGRFRDPPTLRKGFEAAIGAREIDDVILMCGSGVTACHGIFALELAGMPGARLYPGSWSEWIRSPDRPIARD